MIASIIEDASIVASERRQCSMQLSTQALTIIVCFNLLKLLYAISEPGQPLTTTVVLLGIIMNIFQYH
jgi:hypothetical protein